MPEAVNVRPTPETDDAIHFARHMDIHTQTEDCYKKCYPIVSADVARSLERRLGLAIELLEGELWDHCYCIEGYKSRGLQDPHCQYHDQEEIRAALPTLRKP